MLVLSFVESHRYCPRPCGVLPSCCSHLIGMMFFSLVFGVLLFCLALSGFSWMGLVRMDWGTGLCTVLIEGVMGHYNPSL